MLYDILNVELDNSCIQSKDFVMKPTFYRIFITYYRKYLMYIKVGYFNHIKLCFFSYNLYKLVYRNVQALNTNVTIYLKGPSSIYNIW